MQNIEGSIKDLAVQEYTLKEGSWTRLKITFKVHNQVVLGLKVCSAIKTKVKLFNDEEVIGTYAPDPTTTYTECTDWVQTPSGILKRG